MQKTIPSNLMDAEFQRIFNETKEKVKYIKPALMAVRDDWYGENKTLFTLKGPGKYTDLKDGTKRYKTKRFGSPYPILLAKNGRIKSGLTDKQSEFTVNELTDTSLTVGVKGQNYFLFQQKGTRKMSSHPFIFKSQKDGADQWTNQRDRWVKIFTEYQSRRLAAMGNV